MKNFLLTIIAAATIAGCQNKETAQVNNRDNQIIIGHIDSLHSTILKESRNIWVYLPEGVNMSNEDQVGYPVVFLLDGDDHFHSFTGMIQQLSSVNGNTVSPEMIIVGIPNTDRTRDLTPTHVDVAYGDSTFVRTSGGGNNFLDFMEKELIPYIEKKYPVSGYRTLVGHSFGGLTVINALLDRPQLFENYVAIDPSLWWDDQLLLKKADSVFTDARFDGKSLYVAVANTIDEGLDISRVRSDTSGATKHIRSIFQFIESVEVKKDNRLLFGWKYYGEDDHGSVPLIAEYDAVRFIFPWYRLKGLDKFFNPNSIATTEELMTLVTSHYENVSTHFGYVVHPPEQFVNSLAYDFLPNMPDNAYALFNLNIQNFPKSANVYDSMGDYFLSQSDTLKAMEHFAKAVEMGGEPVSKEKLESLRSSM